MSTATRLVAFVAGLLLVLAAAVGVGRVAGPVGEPEANAATHHADASSPSEGPGHGEHAAKSVTSAPGGLQVSDRGYTLALDRSTADTARRSVQFRILGPDGTPVRAYDRQHDKELHLIVVRRDLSGYQHLHPKMDRTGRWSTDARLGPGSWRVFADFKPKGKAALTLGADLTIAGSQRPTPLPQPAKTTTVDGYTVSLKGGLAVGRDSTLRLSVSKDGAPVTDLEPYLGAYGHLVALRAGDLGYLHVHPDGEPGDGTTEPGPGIAFHTTAPSQGSYRLYLDFKHHGEVRTAQFSVRTDHSH